MSIADCPNWPNCGHKTHGACDADMSGERPSSAPYASQNCLPNGIRHLMPMVRVASITLDGTTLTVPAKELADHMAALDDNAGTIEGDEVVFTLTFKTMLVRDFEALGEFNGF